MDLKGAEIRSFKEIGQIINDNSKRQYPLKVPHYQRPYRWKRENVEKLIDDWFSHEEKSDYFCGSIVTVTHDNKPHDLIDGQQRFTTLFLANYINFMVLRSLVFSTLKYQAYAMRFMTLYDEMLDSLNYVISLDSGDSGLFSQAGLKDLKDSILEEIGNDNIDGAIEIFSNSFSDRSIEEKILRRNLILQYDRRSFNDALKKVMGALKINLENESDIYFSINLDAAAVPYTDNENTYVQAIEAIFYNVRDKIVFETSSAAKIKSVQMALSFKKIVTDFIDEVKVCIVQTGNPDDAYTLFEVLNDRALALDDLDLIKNEFYKNYVLKGESDTSEDEKDEVLQTLDNRWVDDIFRNTQEYEKKLITYLAVGYITGSETIKYDYSKGYRDALKDYFNNYNSSNPYSSLSRDFNIFLSCKSFIKKFNLKYQKKDLAALQAEYSEDASASLKVVHLLYAKDQFGVLIGFSNFIFRNIEVITPDFNISVVDKILDIILKPKYKDADSIIHDIHSKCNLQAQNLWQVAIMAKDYKRPRAFAIGLIRDNFLNSSRVTESNMTIEINKDLNLEFESWLRSWRYSSNSKNTLSVRILFARLIKMKLDKSSNQFSKATITNSISQDNVVEMQLDHIEPVKIDGVAKNKYFDHINRERYVNELGNMMPLPGSENRDKSNKPVMESFKFFEKSGLQDHFILLHTKDLFERNRDLVAQTTDYYVPNESFFDERKEVLISWFKRALEY